MFFVTIKVFKNILYNIKIIFKTLVNLNYFVKLYDKIVRKKIGMSLNKVFFCAQFYF